MQSIHYTLHHSCVTTKYQSINKSFDVLEIVIVVGGITQKLKLWSAASQDIVIVVGGITQKLKLWSAASHQAGSADIEIVVGGISRSLGRRNHTLLKLWSAESQEIVCDMNAWIFVVSPSAAHCRIFVVACSKGLHQSILAWTKTTRMK